MTIRELARMLAWSMFIAAASVGLMAYASHCDHQCRDHR